MVNRKRDAGREVWIKKEWWKGYRWLLLRRLSQFLVLAMLLNGPWLDVWIPYGDYSNSLLLDAIPFTDPLITLQNLASRHSPAMVALAGAVIITVLYALTDRWLFYSWACPMNLVTDLASWLRKGFDLNQSVTLPYHIWHVLLAVILVDSALTGTLLWGWIDPVSLLRRSLVVRFDSGALLTLVLFSFDLPVTEHDWCGYLCSLGVLCSAVRSKGILTVSTEECNRCNRCMDCSHVCPELHMLRTPVLDEQNPVQVISYDCVACGRCVDACPKDAFTIITRRSSGVKS